MHRRSYSGHVVLSGGLLLFWAGSAFPGDFWGHWGDGRAEMNGFRLTQPRYGALRSGTAVLIFVTEDMSDSLRVKADPGKHAPRDVYPVMKLNFIRHFQTGIYDYDIMTSTFARVAPGWPVAKVSLSSREWCGNIYHHLLPRGGRIEGVFHSYFDGEADGKDDIPLPPDGVLEDALPVLLRSWQGEYLAPGESRAVPFLSSLFRARIEHRGLAWERATIARSLGTSRVHAPAGTFEVVTWTVAPDGAPPTTYQIEAAPPYRLVRWASESREEGLLLGSTRLAYWKLNGPGGESHLREMGLSMGR